MIVFYKLFIVAYTLAIRLSSLWNVKAKMGIEGRKGLWQKIEKEISSSQPIIWIHAASAGEFEQAKPIIENLKRQYPNHKILISFFSASGFTSAKNYSVADYKFYLPFDTKKNAQRFLELVQPQLVIFIKYDFWYYHLKAIHEKKIPLLLVSAVFLPHMLFFKPYGKFYKKMLFYFKQIFVQDPSSLELLIQNRIHHCQISGDTRFDRVIEIAENFTELPFISYFINGQKVLIAGSTWPEDEKILLEISRSLPCLKIIIAPHEINEAHLTAIRKQFSNALFYSTIQPGTTSEQHQVLVIDNVGMLSRLYQYATVSYIGGGFTKDGVHNTLEAAIWGKPVVWGPTYQKYREAKELIQVGGGFTFETSNNLAKILEQLFSNNEGYTKASIASRQYILSNKGATKQVLHYIQENRLLTN